MYTFIHQFQSISAIESAIRTFKTQWYFYFPTPARYRARAEWALCYSMCWFCISHTHTHTHAISISRSYSNDRATMRKAKLFFANIFSAHLWFLCQINAAALAGVNGFFSLRKWECAANELHTHIQFGTNFKPIPSMIFKIVCLQLVPFYYINCYILQTYSCEIELQINVRRWWQQQRPHTLTKPAQTKNTHKRPTNRNLKVND